MVLQEGASGELETVILEFQGEERGLAGATLMEQATEQFEKSGIPPPVSERYVACAHGDVKYAERRWLETLRWRVDYNINRVMKSPRKRFDLLKKHFPQYYHGKSKEGYNVYYQRLGRVDWKALFENGVKEEEIVEHLVFGAEFTYRYLSPDDSSKTISVIDCTGLRFDPFDRLVRVFRAVVDHYPEKSAYLLVINIPFFLKVTWLYIAKCIVRKPNLEWIKVIGGSKASQKLLLEHIDIDQLPKELGGQSPFPLGASPEERLLHQFVDILDKRSAGGGESEPKFRLGDMAIAALDGDNKTKLILGQIDESTKGATTLRIRVYAPDDHSSDSFATISFLPTYRHRSTGMELSYDGTRHSIHQDLTWDIQQDEVLFTFPALTKQRCIPLTIVESLATQYSCSTFMWRK